MRSLLELSARGDSAVDLADWAEISAFFHDDRSVSQEDLVRALVREGGGRAEQGARDKADEAFNELGEREAAVGNAMDGFPLAAYPYALDGDLLRLRADPFDADHSGLLYAFLLTITRASMESETRCLNQVDPTTLFEELCAEALCEFWGGRSPVSGVFVTGTSNRDVGNATKKRFPKLIDLLAGHLHEGGGWKAGARSPGAGDGGLDLAVWRKFHDKRPGGLIGFAQCKTGDHWRDYLGRHNPRSICQKFFRARLVLSPLPVYMVPCRVSLDEWESVMEQHQGILFDRCRIASLGTRLPEAIITSCESWLNAAIDRERQDLIARGLMAAPVAAGVAP